MIGDQGEYPKVTASEVPRTTDVPEIASALVADPTLRISDSAAAVETFVQLGPIVNGSLVHSHMEGFQNG